MRLVIRRADTGAVIAASEGGYSDPQMNDTLLRCTLAEARLTSMVKEYDVSVTRLFETSEIARYSGGQRL